MDNRDSRQIICDGVLDRDNNRVALTPTRIVDPAHPNKEWKGVVGGNLLIADKDTLDYFEHNGGRAEYALTIAPTGNPSSAGTTAPFGSSSR